MLWVPWFLFLTFLHYILGELSSESTWLQQTVNSSLTKECQNGDSTKPDSTPRSLPNTWMKISSVTLCEENIMFWEVSGIGSEVIGLLWNLSILEHSTGLFFLGLFLSLIVLLFSSPLGHSCV